MSLIIKTFMAICLGLLLITESAQAKPNGFDANNLQPLQQSIQNISDKLKHPVTDVTLLQKWISEVTTVQHQAESCVKTQEAAAESLKTEISALGPLVKGEAWQVTSKRYSLERQQTQTAQSLANCRLLQVNSNALYKELQARHSQEMTSQLLIRGRATLPLFMTFIQAPPPASTWLDVGTLRTHLLQFPPIRAGILLLLTLFGLFAGLFKRQRIKTLFKPIDPQRDRSRAFRLALVISLNHYRPGLLITGLWSLFWLVSSREAAAFPLPAFLSYALFIYQVFLTMIRSVFDPPAPAVHYMGFASSLSHRFARLLRWLSLNALIGVILLASPFTADMNETVILLVRSLWGTLFIANLVFSIWLIRQLRQKEGIGLFRLAFSSALIVGLIAEWSGYRNLSQFLVSGIVYSLVILLLAWLTTSLLSDVFNSLEEGRRPWEKRLRARLAPREDGFIPGLFWLRLLLNVLIWGSVALALLRIWGLSATGQSLLLHYLTQGFTLGKISIVPSRIAFALLILALLLSLGSWARTELDQRLSHARLERGAREAAVAITGYLVAIAAGLIALSIAGFNFQNLALIAGALSVGIGFGLQNIVNNFVSGLILLFERPIRTGDWITVGQIEGYVRRISIRSTQIQTFDRADVVVPNSDLISGPVTNWMLRDTFGRVRVPVGVAYGTDTQLVKDTLLELAAKHPQIIVDHGAIPNPYVLFMAFGDSSLNFELRAYIHDVSNRLSVISDLNFAIDTAFKQAGISIPFPQRDIHIIRDTLPIKDEEPPIPTAPAHSPTPPGQTPPG